MSMVFVYGFNGVHSGKAEYEYRYPKKGVVHKCIMFLVQEQSELDFELAQSEIGKFGFLEVEGLSGNQVKEESLNSEDGQKFQPFYEEAIREGSSLVVFSNA